MSAASANVVLDTVNDPEFLKEVQEKGAYIKEKVLGFHSPAVKNVRGMGLMLGIIVDRKSVPDTFQSSWKRAFSC